MARWLTITIALALVVLGACGGGDDPRVAELEAQVTDLQAQLEEAQAQLEEASSTTTTTAAPTRSILGHITLGDNDAILTRPGSVCVMTGGYDDIAEGAQVVVRDGDGNVVAVGALGAGEYFHDYVDCVFGFTVEGVPGDLAFYEVEVSHRGGITYSRQELEANDWTVELSLG